MRRWFLSYNSQDFDLAHRLVSEIKHKDAAATMFFAPTSLRPGAYWMPTLAKEIAEASVFVLLIGKNGLGPWQTVEYLEAFDRLTGEQDFPVIVLLLDGQPAPGLPFLRQLHWIVAGDPASESSVARVMSAAEGGGGAPDQLWRHTAPYRGLSAMTEADADFFFGRGRETAEVINTLVAQTGKIPILLGNSGVGKSSLAQAGVLAALMRQGWLETSKTAARWPQSLHDTRRWCFLKLKPGAEPVRALVEPFLYTWQFDSIDSRRAEIWSDWTERLAGGKVTLRDLLNATQDRYRDDLHQPEPPAFLLYVDQGEELYARAAERERRRFSELLAAALPDPRLQVMMSMRGDFFGDLQKDEALYSVHQLVNVPPLREAQLREVVSRPAELLSARFESPSLVDIIARRTAEDSAKDVGALPLLSYTLDDMWTQMVHDGEGVLRLPAQSFELGGVLVERANNFLGAHPGGEDALRRLLTLRLATVHEDGEPTRRRAPRSEFSETEWRLVSELADHPNRLLVTVAGDLGETYAEVAHEAIFRRWDKLRNWIAAEREFLAWRSSLEAARHAWAALSAHSKRDALLMGYSLARASTWLAHRAEDIAKEDREFIVASIKAAQQRRFRLGALIGGVALIEAFLLILGFVGWINQSAIRQQWRFYVVTRPFIRDKVQPYVLTATAELALKAADTFRECATEEGQDYCPVMVVVPAGAFMMGSPPTEQGRYDDEGPQHVVTFAQAFAVSRFELTFAEWDTCAADGDCADAISDSGWGRGQQPVINVTLDDAQHYVTWLSKMTGRTYRLLTEAEYEYATRAGTTTTYFFGDDPTALDQYAWYEANSGDKTHAVGKKLPNAFGLYDVVGNVYSMVQDCYHASYRDAPADGSAWSSTDCSTRVLRGGSWAVSAEDLRSALRQGAYNGGHTSGIGFRVARTLGP